MLAYLNNPATRPDALKIMAARDGVTPVIYQRYVKGTHILSLAEAKQAFVKSSALLSIYVPMPTRMPSTSATGSIKPRRISANMSTRR